VPAFGGEAPHPRVVLVPKPHWVREAAETGPAVRGSG